MMGLPVRCTDIPVAQDAERLTLQHARATSQTRPTSTNLAGIPVVVDEPHGVHKCAAVHNDPCHVAPRSGSVRPSNTFIYARRTRHTHGEAPQHGVTYKW